jgi:hypothetical protein
MARSVSTPSNAAQVAYASFSSEDEYAAQDDFDDAIAYLQEMAHAKYPSLSPSDRWLHREDHVVMENRRACITVSEYCGLVAVAVVPLDPDNALDVRWASQIDIRFLAECFGPRLISRGRFSNGEQMFAPADGVQRGEMGLGFTSKEGWL